MCGGLCKGVWVPTEPRKLQIPWRGGGGRGEGGQLPALVSLLVWVLGTKLNPLQKQYPFFTLGPSPQPLLRTFKNWMSPIILSFHNLPPTEL